jgi:hypothetical protein
VTSVIGIVTGITLLAVSLATRNDDVPAFVPWISGWLGSLLVIVGTGKLLFVDD